MPPVEMRLSKTQLGCCSLPALYCSSSPPFLGTPLCWLLWVKELEGSNSRRNEGRRMGASLCTSTQYCLSKFEYWEEHSCIACFPTRDNAHCCSAWLIHRVFQISYGFLWAVLLTLINMLINTYPEERSIQKT